MNRAYGLLKFWYVLMPIAAGIDKFTMLLYDWHEYLATWIENLMPFDPHLFLYAVGVIEIVAGLLVAFATRVGAIIVAIWLFLIAFNLLFTEHLDIMVRDVGLGIGALALASLAGARRQAPVA